MEKAFLLHEQCAGERQLYYVEYAGDLCLKSSYDSSCCQNAEKLAEILQNYYRQIETFGFKRVQRMTK